MNATKSLTEMTTEELVTAFNKLSNELNSWGLSREMLLELNAIRAELTRRHQAAK